jgi:hypothetical protein
MTHTESAELGAFLRGDADTDDWMVFDPLTNSGIIDRHMMTVTYEDGHAQQLLVSFYFDTPFYVASKDPRYACYIGQVPIARISPSHKETR